MLLFSFLPISSYILGGVFFRFWRHCTRVGGIVLVPPFTTELVLQSTRASNRLSKRTWHHVTISTAEIHRKVFFPQPLHLQKQKQRGLWKWSFPIPWLTSGRCHLQGPQPWGSSSNGFVFQVPLSPMEWWKIQPIIPLSNSLNPNKTSFVSQFPFPKHLLKP